MNLVVEEGIPIATQGRKSTADWSILLKMLPGQSFKVSAENYGVSEDDFSPYAPAASVRRYANRHRIPIRVSVAADQSYVRVWRV